VARVALGLRWRAWLRRVGRALRHPRYALQVLGSLLARPRLLWRAARRGWRAALLAEARELLPEAGSLLTPYEATFFAQVFLFDEYEVGGLRLPAEPRVVDVGANVGLFAWRVAALWPQARILALEPARDNHARLERMLAALGVRGRAVRAAAGRRAGRATLYLRSSVTHSLRPDWHPDLDRGAGVEDVEVVTVDGAVDAAGFDRVDLLKVDVEGAELDVLAGAEATLARTRYVVLEYHSRELGEACANLLAARGFRCRHKRFWGARAAGDREDQEGILLAARRG
jgi:FkbM family methyltransferase